MSNIRKKYICQPIDGRTLLEAVGAGTAIALFGISRKVIAVWNCVSYDGGGVKCQFSWGLKHG